MNYISVAIDGPSGAGKSTLARKAASILGYLYVDTGAIYRTVALSAVRRGIDPADTARLLPTLNELDIQQGRLSIVDRGALDCVIRARVETAVLRGKGE